LQNHVISGVQWLYNDQTFNNGIRLAIMNNGLLACIHKIWVKTLMIYYNTLIKKF